MKILIVAIIIILINFLFVFSLNKKSVNHFPNSYYPVNHQPYKGLYHYETGRFELCWDDIDCPACGAKCELPDEVSDYIYVWDINNPHHGQREMFCEGEYICRPNQVCSRSDRYGYCVDCVSSCNCEKGKYCSNNECISI